MFRNSLIYCSIVSSLFSSIGPEGFHSYKNRVFVETGSYKGEGIKKALEAGFSEVYSVEIHFPFFSKMMDKFRKYPNVKLLHGDSAYVLRALIEKIHEPITFWLDAHNVYENKERPWIRNSPLLDELEQIKQHPIKNHTILIDDMDLSGGYLFDGATIEQIKMKILEINPMYSIKFIDGGFDGRYKENILVAEVL